MSTSRLACGVALCLLARTVAAEPLAGDDPTLPHFTISQALDQARQHEPSLRAALAELKAAKEERRVPRAEWMPRIGVTAQIFAATNNDSTAMYDPIAEVDLPRTGSTGGHTEKDSVLSPNVSTIVAASLDQEVYDFGRISAKIALADAAARGASANADLAMLDVLLHADESFHSVLAAHEVLLATEEAYKRAITHRDYAVVATKSGLLPPIDLTRAQADVARLEVQRVRSRAGLRVARANFSASIGSTDPEVEAVPDELDDTRSLALDEVLRLAARQNPAIAAAQARLEQQQANTRVVTHGMLPDLFLTAGISGRAAGWAPTAPPPAEPRGTSTQMFGNGWLPDVPNWHLGLVLGWTVFDGTVLAQRRVSKAREEAAAARLDVARLAVAVGAERAWVDLDSALKALPELQRSLDAAKANWQQADARFRAGLGNVIELADAEALLTNSMVDLAVGEFNIARTRAQLGRAIGDASIIPGQKRP